MAYLSVTDWNEIQDTNAVDIARRPKIGLVDAVKDGTPFVDFLSPSAKKQLNEISSIRDVKFPYLKDQTIEVVTTPGFEFIPTNLPESGTYNFTVYDVFSGFRHYPATYANNVIEADFAKKSVMTNVAYKMGQTIQGIIAARLEERKTQKLEHLLQVSQGDGTFTFAANTLSVNKAAQKETMFSNLTQLMSANEVGGNYRIVTNPGGLAVQKSEALKFGAGNSKNLEALGFFGAEQMYEDHLISGGSDVFNGWLIRDGAMGLFENYPWDFRNGTKIKGMEWSISDVEVPFVRMRLNVYTNSEATNADALVAGDSNAIMTHFEEEGLWSRFYVVYPVNDDLANRSNDIVKIKGLTT